MQAVSRLHIVVHAGARQHACTTAMPFLRLTSRDTLQDMYLRQVSESILIFDIKLSNV